MADNLLDTGLELTLYGMGTVFVFLTLLIFATSTMSRLVLKYAAPSTDGSAAGDDAKGPLDPQQQDLVAVLTAAVHHYRRNKKQ